ncbi:rhodopsin, G0-coupled-like [Anneissia japonica]|uniref:rhodopsin, G0-coupled-like n=1 Tax=Anneissia japonica TaxID=1529436 RepID=UPI0014259C41|nr:rhodopsin, G0-coupled-like [Anneissia japonica]
MGDTGDNFSLYDTFEEMYSENDRRVQAVILGFICIAGIIGNCLVLFSFMTTRKLHNNTNIFVANLALSDLIVCLNLPITIIAIVSDDKWPLHEGICVVNSILLIVCTGCSLYTMACIALLRYVYISNFKYKNVLKMHTCIFIVIFAWLFSTTCTVSPVLFGYVKMGYNRQYHSCSWSTAGNQYSLIIAVVFYPIPFICIFLSYFSILRVVCRKAKNVQPAASQLARNITNRNLAVTKNLFTVFCVFVMCGFPYSLLIILPDTDRVISYAAILLMCNCFINPIIYAFKHPEFKKVIPGMIMCKGIVTPNKD